VNEITDLADAICRERPKPEAGMAYALLDLIEAVLLEQTTEADIEILVDRYNSELSAVIDRRLRRYLNGVEIIG
jgi:hypothetical protein